VTEPQVIEQLVERRPKVREALNAAVTDVEASIAEARSVARSLQRNGEGRRVLKGTVRAAERNQEEVMGEARRRKLLGLYPDTTKPALRDTGPVDASAPKRYLACALCGESGGTLVNGPKGLVHAPDCEYAAA
jgi:hypothetical protein